MRDPYEVLGVSKSASEADIKKAFRALAKKHHPDKHAGDSGAQKRFQEISAAYDILGDKDKRTKFDQGVIDANGNPRGFDPGAGGFRPGAGPGDFHFAWGDADFRRRWWARRRPAAPGAPRRRLFARHDHRLRGCGARRHAARHPA
jgi:curved DNA-binding protein CbpA